MVKLIKLNLNNILQIYFVYVLVTVRASRDLFIRMTEAAKQCVWQRSNPKIAEKNNDNMSFPSYIPRYDVTSTYEQYSFLYPSDWTLNGAQCQG